MRELYKQELFFFIDDFVVWNWLNRSIVNIIHIIIIIALRSLNKCFVFVILIFDSISFLSFFQLKQKNNMCFIIV